MTQPIGDWPDFTRAILIVGKDADGNPVGVFVDGSGFLAAILKGQKPDTTLATVALDASGRIIMVPYGTTEVSGTATVTQAAKDREIQGSDGAALRTVSVDANGQMIMVPRGQSGNYMLVDADGFLTAVLKGEYAGALHTMAVDANGRLEAFILDGEDQWGSILRIGSAEAAARAGSLMAYDWRGHILVQQDFSRGPGNWYSSTNGAGSSVALGPDFAAHGGYTILFTAAKGSGYYAKAQWIYGRNPSDRIGLEVGWSALTYGGGSYLQIGLLVQDGAQRWLGRIKINTGTTQISYLDENGVWQSFASVYVSLYPYSLAYGKLVVDAATGYYVRFLLNGVEYDLSAHAMSHDAIGFPDTAEIELIAYASASSAAAYYVDYFVMTLDEP